MELLNNQINLEEFLTRLKDGAFLLLDYDGTLTPFHEDRMKAFPYPGIETRLKTLVEIKKNRTIIISGRRLSDLKKLLNVNQIELWGSHGLERQLPNGEEWRAPLSPQAKEGLKLGIQTCASQINPSHYEIKPFGIALHKRGIKDQKSLNAIHSVVDFWRLMISNYDLEVHIFDGGFELRPKNQGKGDVIKSLLKEGATGFPIAYLGDDFTDEEAFAALGPQALKILVRSELRDTLADIRLTSSDELLWFLDLWILNTRG